MFKQRTSGPRLLVVPGLKDSGPVHWQTWLASLHRDSVRVVQDDWLEPDLDRWAARVAHTLERHRGDGDWLVAAHSFGCLALARHLKQRPDLPVAAALMVAPADPRKFGVLDLLPTHRLPCPSVLVGSQNDPWMSAPQAKAWANRWGSQWVNLGDAGHINAEAGFGPWPYAQRWVVANQQRWARQQRPVRAAFSEWTFAI